MRYPIVIHKDVDSDYGVIVPDIPGCHSVGSSYDDAIDNAHEAIECHLEGLLFDNESIPVASDVDTHIKSKEYRDGTWAFVEIDLSQISGKSKRVNITMPEKILKIIDLYSKHHEQKNRSAFLADAALSYIERSKRP
jgi:predicted RNase H-like HicB family nuclease